MKQASRRTGLIHRQLVDANCGMLSLSSDGSVNWPRTLRLAEFAYRSGTQRAVVAAPYDCIDVLDGRLPHLRGLLSQHRIPIEIAPALEFGISHELFERVIHASLVFGGLVRRYVFLRLRSDGRLPVVPVVKELRRMNLTPILLSPERCVRFRADDTELRQIVSSGALVQLSAASLTDQTDRARIRYCRHLIRKGLCHMVATESGRHHDLPISFGDAFAMIAMWAGESVAVTLCRQNPGRVFEGKLIESAPTQRRRFNVFSRAAA